MDRFADAGGFDELEVVWFLIASVLLSNLPPKTHFQFSHSHSVAAQNDIDPTIPRTPFDSTPTIMDGQFFIETQLRGTAFPGQGGIQGVSESPLKGEFRLQSDQLVGIFQQIVA